jgi:hypothetical protein
MSGNCRRAIELANEIQFLIRQSRAVLGPISRYSAKRNPPVEGGGRF